MEILSTVHDHNDLLGVPAERMEDLCAEIRAFLVENVSRTGGHLASSLGAVELTVALHRVYDPMKDRILFDVGHQSYVHKMLTGRMDRFSTLRQIDGLAGFPKPEESAADPFVAGHASDSVSVAMGMARARTLRGEDYDIVAVVGDGSMTGGLCFEGLSDAGGSDEPIVVVLNDNGMSINESVGGISSMLRAARTRPGYIRFKQNYRRVMKHLPAVYHATHELKEHIKNSLLPPGIFDDMGFQYIGPVDGHDESKLEQTLRWARELREPVLVHVVTQKGKGYGPAETRPELYHGVEPFDPAVGVKVQASEDFSSCFGRSAARIAALDETVCAVTAAMESGTGLDYFSARYPDRFMELGNVEEHAVAMCAGMARQGLKPVFAVYSTFLQRAYDMLVEDVGLMGLHVVLAVDRAGLVGADGATHQGSFDVSFLGSVPGMKVFAPASYRELDSMLETALLKESGPVALRYPRGSEGDYKENNSDEPAVVLRTGTDLTIVCYGILVNEALKAAERLSEMGVSAEVLKLQQIVPLPEGPVLASLRKTGALLSVEDVCRPGSVGTRCLALAAENGVSLRRARRMDLGDGVVPHGAVQKLRERYSLDAEGIVRTAKELLG